MIEDMKAIKKMDVRKVAAAIEKDAGCALPRLREALQQAKTGNVIIARQGASTHAETKDAEFK